MSDPLTDAVALHIGQVDARVAGGPYAEESVEIRQAAAALPGLVARLELTDFVASLNPGTGKPQLLLHFDSTAHGDVVLKVYGVRRPEEAATEVLWAAASVPTVEILAHGDDPLSWLLMRRVVGARPEGAPPELTRQVAGIMRQAHRIDAVNAVGGDLWPRITRHLDAVLAAAERHGYDLGSVGPSLLHRAFEAGHLALLHADLAPANLLRDSAGRLLLLDASGCRGPAEFDAARWCARVGGATSAVDLLQQWLLAEPELDESVAARLVGAELLMQAGVREILKEEQRRDWREPDPETEQCLRLGHDLLTR